MAVAGAALLFGGCATPSTRTGPEPTAALAGDFAELAATIPARVGVAVAAVGGTAVSAFGPWSTGVAWSTIKVPLAIAALRAEGTSATTAAVKAISRSDNAAAERLWSDLGPPARAARRVRAVLREAGDPATIVESRRLRADFTAFGQTRWSLRRQAQFAAHLPCLADAGGVVALMGNLAEDQRWGLAAAGVAAKGGWGPRRSGGYLVRQFGIVSTPAGELGVALAAEPDAGTFAAGVDALNRMAGWLTAHRSELPGGHCPE